MVLVVPDSPLFATKDDDIDAIAITASILIQLPVIEIWESGS